MERGTNQTDGGASAKAEKGQLTETQLDHLWKERETILFRTVLNSRYHRRRERFFDGLERGTQAVALIGGTSAFAAVSTDWMVMVSGALVAVSGAVALVFGFAEKARRHAALAESFKRLEADVLGSSDYDLDEAQIMAWRGKRAEIESGEPPALRPLILMCENDMDVARGEPNKVVNLPPWLRVAGYFFDFDVSDWVTGKKRWPKPRPDTTKSPA